MQFSKCLLYNLDAVPLILVLCNADGTGLFIGQGCKLMKLIESQMCILSNRVRAEIP